MCQALSQVLWYTKLDEIPSLLELQFKGEYINQIINYINNCIVTTLIGDINDALRMYIKGI